jgi:hypothetical protein
MEVLTFICGLCCIGFINTMVVLIIGLCILLRVYQSIYTIVVVDVRRQRLVLSIGPN